MRRRVAILLLCAAALGPALSFAREKPYVYVGQISSDSVLLAWGTLGGRGNTIGREAAPLGLATIRIDNRTLTSDKSWALIEGLRPDTEYVYTVEVAGKVLGEGKVRTHPRSARKLAFFVMGDFGNGSRAQYRVAEVMQREFQKRQGSDNPVRFVITTGDNIYGDLALARRRHTGNEDSEWESKFFRPYEKMLRSIPFCPSLGNHDGNVSELRGDLAVYLDNFFCPGSQPARYYHFNVGGLADFFALDSTWNTLEGPTTPAYTASGEQFQWMKKEIPAATAPWKIAFFHHPPFSAGPKHAALLGELKHWVELFGESGVSVVFNGHEHNFQFSERSERTRGVLYVVSGAGGELRKGDVLPRLAAQHIAGWAPKHHFLLVEIEARTMRITPLGAEPIAVRSPEGKILPMPIVVKLP